MSRRVKVKGRCRGKTKPANVSEAVGNVVYSRAWAKTTTTSVDEVNSKDILW